MYYCSNLYMIELNITKQEALTAFHSGQCDKDVEFLAKKPRIKRQLKQIDKDKLALELEEYGAWGKDELKDHEQNLLRLLWLACGDIVDYVKEGLR